MAQLQELKRIPMTKGCHMRIYIDHEQPLESPQHRFTETCYDGEPGSIPFETPLHWHKYHDELISVAQGQAEVEIEGRITVMSQGDPEVRIPAWQVHAIRCLPGVPLVLREATDPTGDFKERFFRDFFESGTSPSFLYMMRVFWDGDVYGSLNVPLIGRSQLVDQIFITIFGGIAKLLVPARKPIEEPAKWDKDKAGMVQVAMSANV